MIDVDQGAAGEVAIHHHLEDVVVQVGAGEIPVVIVGLVEKIQPVQAFHPPDLHADIEALLVHPVGVLAGIVDQLIAADRVFLGHHGPVIGVAVDAGDHVGGNWKIL